MNGVLNAKLKILAKPEKLVGYVLLIIGFVVVIIPTYFGILIIFSGGSTIPEILETPALSLDDVTAPTGNEAVLLPISRADINEIIQRTFPTVNLGLFLAIAVILISAGSVLMGKGVSLIKEVNLRVVRERAGEDVEVEKDKEAEKKED